MVLLRHLLGDALRRLRLRQGRTLREVSATARVSLGYLSEVERGQKEASSELLASICDALGAPLSQVLREVSDNFALAELQSEPVFGVPLEPALARAGGPASPDRVERVPAGQPQRVRLPQPARQGTARRAVVVPDRAARAAQRLVPPEEPLLEPVSLPDGDSLARDITNMVPV
jgi:transcriptional regulator with XRE-family HTH domain